MFGLSPSEHEANMNESQSMDQVDKINMNVKKLLASKSGKGKGVKLNDTFKLRKEDSCENEGWLIDEEQNRMIIRRDDSINDSGLKSRDMSVD